jgi:hypothetical protein
MSQADLDELSALNSSYVASVQRGDVGWFKEHLAGRCHTNLDRRGAGFGRPAELQAAVAARHVRNASSLRTRSVRRDVR